MKTPTDFGIDPNGGRYGDGLYLISRIGYYDVEDYLERCRTEFAVNEYGAAPLPGWDKVTQQFLVMANEVYDKGGNDALKKYFVDFAEYVILHLPLSKEIDGIREKNTRILAYNYYVAENSNGKIRYNGEHPDYARELLRKIPFNWEQYWEYCGSDTHNCGGNFRRLYASKEGHEKWGERYDYFISELTQAFITRIKEEC